MILVVSDFGNAEAFFWGQGWFDRKTRAAVQLSVHENHLTHPPEAGLEVIITWESRRVAA